MQGACAAVVAGVVTGRLDRKCKVSLEGGDLFIDWDEASDDVFKIGAAVKIFDGEMHAN